MIKKQAREVRDYLPYTSILLFIIKGSQDRKPKWGRNLEERANAEAKLRLAWRVLLTDLLPMACSTCSYRS